METSALICRANQWTMIGTSVIKELIHLIIGRHMPETRRRKF